MDRTKELTKVLPRSREEINIEIEVTGSDGETVTVQISRPNTDLSQQTGEKYKDHRWGRNRFWYEVMEDALDDTEYEVKSETHKTNSGNVYFRGGKIEFDYYEEARIDDVVEMVLQELDKVIILQSRKRSTENKKTEAAQEQVSEDLADDLESIFTEGDEEGQSI